MSARGRVFCCLESFLDHVYPRRSDAFRRSTKRGGARQLQAVTWAVALASPGQQGALPLPHTDFQGAETC